MPMLFSSFELVSLARAFDCQRMGTVQLGPIAQTLKIGRHQSGSDNFTELTLLNELYVAVSRM